MRDLKPHERHVVNAYQRDFPLTPRPFHDAAGTLGMGEGELLQTVRQLQAEDLVTRLGTVIKPNKVGASTLAAMAVPPECLDEVAELVSARPEVNHNYEREHALNLWFVVTAHDRDAVLQVLSDIERACGYQVIDLPLEAEYHIDLGFAV
jgi:DNA-binding Lrp family transcriptional regulator